MEILEEAAKDIIEIYSRELNDDEQFHHALEELSKHPSKVSKLYERSDNNHLNEEIVDILLLSHVLKLKAEVTPEEIISSAEHFKEKVGQIYGE